jgi:uncharacterized surface anchored protein
MSNTTPARGLPVAASVLTMTVEVKSGRLTVTEFTNRELPNLYIRKVDRVTGALVGGAEFLIEKNGVFIAAVVSSAGGAVVVPRLQPGVYTITETKARGLRA